ncbi:MAG: NAD-dependent epimerase/dehydratase family protein, partial [Elusimicrobiota bacterium]
MADPWQGRRVLVTGASGFIGGSLLTRLRRAGAAVTAMALPGEASGLARRAEIPPSSILELRLEDSQAFRSAVASIEPEAVFHLAGRNDRVNPADAGALLDSNIRGAYVLLDACRTLGPGSRI